MKGVKTMAQKANSLSQAKWMRMYHIVFTLQYRRKIIYIGVVWEMFFINYANITVLK